ncbi:MAG: DUF4340 domain-containing protein [Ruminococcus sp.]|nr:DUF4340 domain-containing protein [Ruminococcus sp.]
MNGKIQGIIIGAVVVAALGGTLAVLELTGKDKDSSSVTDSSSRVIASVADENENIEIVKVEAKQVKAVAVDNATGGYHLERPSSGKTEFNIKELTGLSLNTTKLADLVSDIASLTGYKTVEENADDLAKYGLKEPNTTFEVTFDDGSTRKFRVGDVSTQKRYRYFCEDGSSKVYMVLESSLKYMIERKEELVITALFPSQTSEEYGTLEITRKDLDYPVRFENVEKEKELISTQIMVSPIHAHLNVTTSSSVTHGIFGLSAGRCELVFPTTEQMEEYGLADPFATVHYKDSTMDVTLKIGNGKHATDDDGKDIDSIASYFCYAEGIIGADCIWEIPASSLSWATFQPGDVLSLMTSNKIYDIGEVKVTTGSGVTDYTLSANEEEAEVYWVKKNGTQDIDTELFKGLYKYLLSIPTKEIWFEEPQGEPFLTIEIKRTDEEGDDKLEFYQDTSRRVAVVLNGEPSYRVQSRWTDTFLENMARIERGEEVQETP